MTRYTRSKLIKAHFSGVPVCPMAGKRAPELAAGCIPEVFDAIAGQALTEVLLAAPLPLSAEQQAVLLSEFHGARDHMRLVLLSKLAHWQRLPWILCGLAHPIEDVGRRIAQDIKDMLQQSPNQVLHHRLTKKFLSDHLRAELCRLLRGNVSST